MNGWMDGWMRGTLVCHNSFPLHELLEALVMKSKYGKFHNIFLIKASSFSCFNKKIVYLRAYKLE